MGVFNDKAMKRILIILLAVIVVGGVVHAVTIDVFNKTVHTVSGADATQQTYMDFSDREDSTSAWVKRDYDLNGKTVDLLAQTVDGKLINDSDDTVKSWDMTIDIVRDCFINNAWVGTVEIHQYVGTDKEAVQTLDLRNYAVEDVELDYLYDGDLLIPLQKGDFIIYHPSEADEFNIGPHAELTMGMIFYYLGGLDLSHYSINYYYYRDFTYGISFIAIAALAIVWVLLFAGWKVAGLSYKRAKRELDLRKSSLASMSSIYSIISFIDLHNDELIPVYASEKFKDFLPQGSGASKKLVDVFERDAAEPYRSEVLEFIDTATLADRLEKGSIALEYTSRVHGWFQVRLFAVDKEEGQPLDRVLLTMQDINDDKRQQERFERNEARAAIEASAKSTFITGASTTMGLLVQTIDGYGEKILDETDEEQVRGYAEDIRRRGKLLAFLADGISDTASTDIGSIKLDVEEYSLGAMVADACDIARMIAKNKELSLEPDISPTIPERLVGDARRIERALLSVIAYAIHRADADAAKLSVYGATHDGCEHILFSVKVSGPSMGEDEIEAIEEYASEMDQYGFHSVDEGLLELEGVALLLMVVGSKLQVVNDPGAGFELYFEIEQKVAGDAPAEGDDDDA